MISEQSFGKHRGVRNKRRSASAVVRHQCLREQGVACLLGSEPVSDCSETDVFSRKHLFQCLAIRSQYGRGENLTLAFFTKLLPLLKVKRDSSDASSDISEDETRVEGAGQPRKQATVNGVRRGNIRQKFSLRGQTTTSKEYRHNLAP